MFREVSVAQIKEALRRWLRGEGERPVAGNWSDIVYLRPSERTVDEGEPRCLQPYRCGLCAVSVRFGSCPVRAGIGRWRSMGQCFPSFAIDHAGESTLKRERPRMGVR